MELKTKIIIVGVTAIAAVGATMYIVAKTKNERECKKIFEAHKELDEILGRMEDGKVKLGDAARYKELKKMLIGE